MCKLLTNYSIFLRNVFTSIYALKICNNEDVLFYSGRQLSYYEKSDNFFQDN